MPDLGDITQSNNSLLKQAVKNAKITKRKLELELIANYSPELFDKLVVFNKEITKAEKLIDCTSLEGKDMYAKEYPDYVDENGEINHKGIENLGKIEKKLGFTRFFKK